MSNQKPGINKVKTYENFLIWRANSLKWKKIKIEFKEELCFEVKV